MTWVTLVRLCVNASVANHCRDSLQQCGSSYMSQRKQRTLDVCNQHFHCTEQWYLHVRQPSRTDWVSSFSTAHQHIKGQAYSAKAAMYRKKLKTFLRYSVLNGVRFYSVPQWTKLQLTVNCTALDEIYSICVSAEDDAQCKAWYGLRMLTASKERSIRHSVHRDNDNGAVMMWNDDGSWEEIPEGSAVVAHKAVSVNETTAQAVQSTVAAALHSSDGIQVLFLTYCTDI